jgi:thiamine kinase-like enzyme
MTDFDATTRYDLHTRLEGLPNHTKLCHGDFKPENVIAAEDGRLYTLDWPHASQGNASGDAALTFLKLRFGGDKAEADSYLNLFCEMSKTDKKYVLKWIPIAAASQLIKARGSEHEFLRPFAEATEFNLEKLL